VNAPKSLQVTLELDAEVRRSGSAVGLPDPELQLAATAEAVNAAEQAVGFPFPCLLRRLWTEVGNGGFGPGYGLLGLEGGPELVPYRLRQNLRMSNFASSTPAPPSFTWGAMSIDHRAPQGAGHRLRKRTDGRFLEVNERRAARVDSALTLGCRFVQLG